MRVEEQDESDEQDEKAREEEPVSGSESDESNDELDCFSWAVCELLNRSKVLFQYAHGGSTMVFQVSDAVVAKLVRHIDATTEYSSLRYLQDSAPDLPIPRPCGLLEAGDYYLMFSSFISGQDLDKVWPYMIDS